MDKKKLSEDILWGFTKAIVSVSVFYFIGMSMIQVSSLFQRSTDNFIFKFFYLIGTLTFLLWAAYYSLKNDFIRPLVRLIDTIIKIIASGMKTLINKNKNKEVMIMKGQTAIIAIVVIVCIIGGIGLWFFSTYNMLVGKQIATDTQWAQVETVYQRRYDLIPNLVESVKGYLKYEKSVLEEVTRLRSQWQTQSDANARVDTSNQLETAISKLLVVIENYPDLKADNQVRALMDELAGTENRISIERMKYNQAVQDYNTAIRVFPSNFIANMYGFTAKEMFKSETGAEKSVKVNLTNI